MQEQLSLIQVEDTYNLNTIQETTWVFIKKKYPHPVECEDYDEYLDFINYEYKCELMDRLQKTIEQIKKTI